MNLFQIHKMSPMHYKGILFLFSMILFQDLYPQEYNFRSFNTEDGLSQSYVYSIIQDAQGYLWVGTGNGLSRFNGFEFNNYTTSDSLSDNFITCSISDGEGIWVGHMNGGLSHYIRKRFNGIKIPQPDASRLTHFAKSPGGRIWVSSYSGGMLKLSNDSGVVKHNLFSDPTIINTFNFVSENDILAGTNDGVLFCRLKDSGEIEIISHVKEIPESKITAILKMRNDSGYYVATENDGIYQLTYSNSHFTGSRIFADKVSDFTGIQDIYEDSQSNLWLCSFGSGLIKLTYSGEGSFTGINYFNTSTGFASDNVKTVFEDREGNIWSGNYSKGLTQITPKTFSVIQFDNPLIGNNIFSFCFNDQFRWTGTENGLVKTDLLSGKIIRFYRTVNGLPKDTVTALYTPDGKEIWIGTSRNGLYRMDAINEKASKYTVGEGALENSITCIAGKGKELWIGTKKGLCSLNVVTGYMIWYTINKGGLPHNLINSLYIDKTDRIWISTRSNTLAYIKDKKVYKVPLSSTTGVTTMGQITEDSDSRIWVASYGNGVFMLQSDSIVNLTVKEGLVSNYCYSLICDGNKYIWVGHKAGLSRIRMTDFSVKPILHINGMADSYQFNPNAVSRNEKGEVLFGSNKGMVSYDPSLEVIRQPAPVTGFTSIKVNDEEKDYNNKIILPPGNYKIRIDFLGISLREPMLVTYQYKLAGYDQWSDITKNTSITYNHLAEGDYTFFLNASSGDGMVSDKPLTLSIIIKKPAWKKWWFYPVNILALFFLVFIYIKRREYKFLAEKRILEEKVVERTYEIQNQKNEIQLQRDLIDEKNASITSSIKYASHIQNSVLPSLAYMNKLFPDNFILSRPKDIVSGDFFWLTEKEDKIIVTVADCTGHGVPGAFMSLLGITFLNEIVITEGIKKSDEIVTELRDRVIHTLKQNRYDFTNSDGMDLALCVVDKTEKKIQYTGGMNDLVYIRNEKLNLIRADRISACILYNNSGSFTKKEIDYEDGDIFYLFSDGYRDQFGGENDKKFMTRRFYQILLEIHKLPMQTQKEILERRLIDWMKDNDQTDDITVMGIRL
jgi:ligand-binding sensor domain-containing protein/serine phosphatase RsbU (regulator of sigma subunit)